MRKWTHGVVEVSSAARPPGHRRTSLLVGRVGMPHRNDQAGFSRRIDARSGTEQFRCNRQNPGIPRGGLEEAAECFRRRQLNPFSGMNSSALLADEGPLEMDPQDFRAGFVRFVLLPDVPGDSLDGAQSLVRTGRYGGGEKGGGAIFRDLVSDGPQGGASSFHHVVATGSVDVHIDKTRDGRLVRGANFLGPRGQGHPRARPDGLNGIFANQDARVVNFCHRG